MPFLHSVRRDVNQKIVVLLNEEEESVKHYARAWVCCPMGVVGQHRIAFETEFCVKITLNLKKKI